ncbi:MAG: hypothetical protein PHE21_02765 [Candidatus Dojkabacteria bacterium]|nr:hypothetical protein [Candidatus Dojkabacteria bacterium]
MNKVYAATNISDFGDKVGINFKEWATLETLIDTKIVVLINWITIVSSVVAVVFLIVAGYTYMTAMGEPDKVDTAQKMITGSIIGLVVIFIARMLVTVVVNLVVQGSPT